MKKKNEVYQMFAENLRYLRGERNLTQAKLTKILKITHSRYGAWEECRSMPRIEEFLEISRFFNTTIDAMVSTDMRKVVAK